MPPPDLADLLNATSAFSGLPADIRRRIASLLEEQKLTEGEVLGREGDYGDRLFLIVEGSIGFRKQSQGSPELAYLGRIGPGEVAGELALLTGHPRAVTMIAEEESLVAGLSRADFELLCIEFPQEMESVVAWMRRQLHAYQIKAAIDESPLLRGLSAAIRQEFEAGFRWMELRSGETLFRQGDPGDALYLIVSGRMQVLQADESAVTTDPSTPGSGKVVSEPGKGDILGELALLTGEPRAATAHAIRDTQLVCLDRASFDRIVATYPKELLQLIVRQMAGRLREQSLGRRPESRLPVSIAVLMCSPLAADFAGQLAKCLSAFGETLHLDRAKTGALFSDRPLAADAAETRLLSWLNDQETRYQHVVYEADTTDASWTSRCLRQADVLFYAADAKENPFATASRLEPFVKGAGCHLRPNLVLYHSDPSATPTNTESWLNATDVGRHWHIRAGIVDDVARVARFLTGRSVGLALGGGFAFGLAHIGVIQALQESGVPIDHVGGTSMGAIIAMMCAFRFSCDRMLEMLEKEWATSLKGDYTLPIVSLLSGRKVAHSIRRYVGEHDVEDFWLPYFAISASLVHARMVILTRGSALRTALASSRAPVIFPPLGWDNDVLVDGGLVNNVPGDVMRAEIGPGTVIAVDVSPETDFSVVEQFDMHLSGWRVAMSRINPLLRRSRPATIAHIIARLMRLGGVAQLPQIRASADLYLMPPLDRFTFRDFHRGEEMSRAAYNYTLGEVRQWIAQHGRPWTGDAKGDPAL
jgi:lysophospholipid hydrolase